MAQQRPATSITAVIIMVLAVSSLSAGAAAQSLSSTCSNVLLSMSPCLSYISGNSSAPSSGCCKQLATVVQSQPQCLCQVISGGGSSLGVSINQTQALALPAACNVHAPAITQCSKASSPTGSSSSGSSGSGGNTARGGSSSDGSTKQVSFSLLFALLVVASYASSSSFTYAV